MPQPIQPQVNQTFTQPIQYPSQEAVHDQTLKEIWSSINALGQAPVLVAQGLHAQNEQDQQRSGELSSSLVQSDLNQRQLSLQEVKELQDKVQQNQANQAEVDAYGQHMVQKTQFLENAKITDAIGALDPEALKQVAASPGTVTALMHNLAHTPESMILFKQQLGQQLAQQAAGLVQQLSLNDQSKTPTEWQNQVVNSLESGLSLNGMGPPSPYHDISDPEVKSYFKASLAKHTESLVAGMLELHAKQVLAASEQSNQIALISGLGFDFQDHKLDNAETATKAIQDRFNTFARSEQLRNTDLTPEGLKSSFYANVSGWLQQADPRFAAKMVNGIISGSPGTEVAQYMKNIQQATNQRLFDWQNSQVNNLENRTKDTLDPLALDAKREEMKQLAREGKARPDQVTRFEATIAPNQQKNIESFNRVNVAINGGLSPGQMGPADPNSERVVLQPEDQPLIDAAVAKARFNPVDPNNPMPESTIYSNIIAHGGILTDTIKNRIQSLANSNNPLDVGQATGIITKMQDINPGIVQNLVNEGKLPQRLALAADLYRYTGEDPVSSAQRLMSANPTYFDKALAVIQNPSVAGQSLGVSFDNRLRTMFQDVKLRLGESYNVGQSIQRYLPQFVTGRPDELPLNVSKNLAARYQDLYVSTRTQNPSMSDKEIDSVIMPKVANYAQQNFISSDFGYYKEPVFLGSVGYAPGATPKVFQQGEPAVPGLYNNNPETAKGSVIALSQFATTMIKKIAAENNTPVSLYHVNPNDVNQDNKGNWVMTINRNDGADNRPVAEINFKNIEDLVHFNENYLTAQDKTQMPKVLNGWLYAAPQQPVNLMPNREQGLTDMRSLMNDAVKDHVRIYTEPNK